MRNETGADWLPVAEARDSILSDLDPLPQERLSLLDALGRVLAEDVTAPMDLPLWDNSAMDGFAVRAADVAGASQAQPRELPVLEDIPAGSFASGPLRPGAAMRIMTGAPVPAGADSVIRVEHTDGGTAIGSEGARVRVFSDSDGGRNVRPRGEDMRQGDVVLRRGTLLRAAELGAAAAMGRSQLAMVRRPVVGVLASGNELVDLDGFSEVLAGRRIVSSNSYALAAQVCEAGAEPRVLGIASDSPESLREHLERARGCDVLITSAGISVGEHDYVREVLRELEVRVRFWRVRMRPGSPLAFGRVERLGGIPWFGLPGNPVSSMVTFELFVRPALLRMSGHTRVFHPTLHVRLRDAYPGAPGLTHFPRVRLHREIDGPVHAALTGRQGSGLLTSMAAADALLVVPEERGSAAPGDVLRALVLGGSPLQAEPGY